MMFKNQKYYARNKKIIQDYKYNNCFQYTLKIIFFSKFSPEAIESYKTFLPIQFIKHVTFEKLANS